VILRAVISGLRDRELVAGMRVLDALLAAPGLGPEKAKRLLLTSTVASTRSSCSGG
jgi:hypothetical protein